MVCKFCQHDLTQVGCCGKTGQPILLCTGCGSLKLCDQEQLPSPLWFEVQKLRAEREDMFLVLKAVDGDAVGRSGGSVYLIHSAVRLSVRSVLAKIGGPK